MPRTTTILLLCLAGQAAAAPTTEQYDELKTALQQILETATVKDSLAIGLGWKDANTEFSLAAGKVNIPGKASRDATTSDTFLYGSGTKTFTATAIMKLVEVSVRPTDRVWTRRGREREGGKRCGDVG